MALTLVFTVQPLLAVVQVVLTKTQVQQEVLVEEAVALIIVKKVEALQIKETLVEQQVMVMMVVKEKMKINQETVLMVQAAAEAVQPSGRHWAGVPEPAAPGAG